MMTAAAIVFMALMLVCNKVESYSFPAASQPVSGNLFALVCRAPSIDQGSHSPDKSFFLFGSTITYNCDDGYEISGQSSAICRLSRWSEPPPKCVKRDGCKGPQEFENGSYEPTKDTYNARDRIWFSCDDSYELVGQQDPTCLPSGEWTSEFPVCEPRPTCSPPRQPLGGVFAPSLKLYNVGDIVTFVCLNDRHLVGNRSIVCLPGRWSHPSPACEELDECKAPEEFENGSYEPTKDTYNARDRIWFSCDDSYELVGQQDPTCLPSGEWTSEFPVCERRPTCDPPRLPLGGVFSPSMEFYNIGDIVTFTCLDDRHLVGSQSIICVPGAWSHPAPICKERDGCKGPQEFENGSYEPTKDTYDARDRIWFNCDDSYELVGQQDPTCLPSGEWTSEFPVCELRPTCNPPRQLVGGLFAPSLGSYNVGDIVTFVCLNNRQLVGNRSIICLPGRWSHPSPMCKERGCFPPRLFQNGAFEPGFPSFQPGERLWFVCDEGYQLNGPRIVSCIEPGVWSRKFPFCGRTAATTCRQPRQPANGAVEPSIRRRYLPGDSVRFSCNYRLNLIGANSAICLSTGIWSHNTPTCRYTPRDVTCQKPQRPANCVARPVQSVYRAGEAITFTCQQNYELIGVGRLVCRSTGAWSAATPLCRRRGAQRRVTCGHPTQPLFGSYSPRKQTYYVGDRIIYNCDSGYLVGQGSRTTSCLNDGHWSRHTAIRCISNNNTCRQRCDNYDETKLCQCHTRCSREGNCCEDYHRECA